MKRKQEPKRVQIKTVIGAIFLAVIVELIFMILFCFVGNMIDIKYIISATLISDLFGIVIGTIFYRVEMTFYKAYINALKDAEEEKEWQQIKERLDEDLDYEIKLKPSVKIENQIIRELHKKCKLEIYAKIEESHVVQVSIEDEKGNLVFEKTLDSIEFSKKFEIC